MLMECDAVGYFLLPYFLINVAEGTLVESETFTAGFGSCFIVAQFPSVQSSCKIKLRKSLTLQGNDCLGWGLGLFRKCIIDNNPNDVTNPYRVQVKVQVAFFCDEGDAELARIQWLSDPKLISGKQGNVAAALSWIGAETNPSFGHLGLRQQRWPVHKTPST
ncbi:hypothetical protein CBL_00639 [Carabus blaptoides fortunei]